MLFLSIPNSSVVTDSEADTKSADFSRSLAVTKWFSRP